MRLTHPIFEVIAQIAKERQQEVYVVGGYVRDVLLERPNKDIDFVTVGKGIEFAEALAQKLKVKVNVFKNFGTAMLKYEDLEIEFVGARKESYQRDSRKPIVEDGTLDDDLLRRDFTINAMAIHVVTQEFIDPFKGQLALQDQILRTPTDANITFSDDPLRMIRAARFATQLHFNIAEDALQAMKANAERIKIVSMERIIVELNKIILSPKPSIGFKILFDTGILHLIFPDLTKLHGVDRQEGLAHKDNFYHTLQVLDNLAPHTDHLWLRWAAILHDIAKPATKRFSKGIGWTFHGHEDLGARMVPRIFGYLKLPMDERMHYVQKLVRLHLRPIALVEDIVTDSALRRLLFDAGPDLEDLMKLCKADITTRDKRKLERFLQNFAEVEQRLAAVESADSLRNWQPPISGELIMQIFNLKPSKEVGLIKNAIREAILEGEIKNEYDAAYQFMLTYAQHQFNLVPHIQ